MRRYGFVLAMLCFLGAVAGAVWTWPDPLAPWRSFCLPACIILAGGGMGYWLLWRWIVRCSEGFELIPDVENWDE